MFDNRHELTIFLAVAEARTILSAAEKLAIPKTKLSRIIDKLEKQFNGQLLERTLTGIQLTQYGHIVADRVRHIMVEIKIAEEEINSFISGHGGKLVVTVDQAWAPSVVQISLQKFSMKYPDVEVNFKSATYAEGIQLMISGNSDLHCGSLRTKGVYSPLLTPEYVLDMTWGVVAHEDHPLHSVTGMYEDLLRYPWIEFEKITYPHTDGRDLPSLSYINSQLYAVTKNRAKAIISTNLSDLSMLQMTGYLSYLPLKMIDNFPELRLRPLPIEFGRRSQQTGFVLRRSARSWSTYLDMKNTLQEVALSEL